MKNFIIEYSTGEVALVPSNILIKDVEDMEDLEFWEDRLKKMNQPYTVVYKKVKDKFLYAIFTDLRNKESVFR